MIFHRLPSARRFLPRVEAFLPPDFHRRPVIFHRLPVNAVFLPRFEHFLPPDFHRLPMNFHNLPVEDGIPPAT